MSERYLGIDPGLSSLGFCLIDLEGNKIIGDTMKLAPFDKGAVSIFNRIIDVTSWVETRIHNNLSSYGLAKFQVVIELPATTSVAGGLWALVFHLSNTIAKYGNVKFVTPGHIAACHRTKLYNKSDTVELVGRVVEELHHGRNMEVVFPKRIPSHLADAVCLCMRLASLKLFPGEETNWTRSTVLSYK